MANNLGRAQNGHGIFKKILTALGKRNQGELLRRMWYSAGVPAVDAGSQTTYPVEIGDLAYDTTNGHAYVCTVAPAAGAAATFVKMHA